MWALQFTPRVTVLEESVAMEVDASTRLFKGRRALRDRVVSESMELGVAKVSWAPNSLAALAFARAGIENGLKRGLESMLDPLPMQVLSAVVPHMSVLLRTGARTLGDVRRLPRAGITRRFDKSLLRALDHAYGVQPEAHKWVEVPDAFTTKLELPFRVEHAPELLVGARKLLHQMCGWLAARHSGITAFTLNWWHDSMRSKDAGTGGGLVVRTAIAMRDIDHLFRLLSEHLAKVTLLAPVGDLELAATEVHALHEVSASLLPDTVLERETVGMLQERLAARFGPAKVCRPFVGDDNRLEWVCTWRAAAEKRARKPGPPSRYPAPSFVLAEPLKLSVRDGRPQYQGPLKLLAGPHSVEDGWWHRDESKRECHAVVRDYWIAWSDHAGPLWIYQTRLEADAAWWLHGSFS